MTEIKGKLIIVPTPIGNLEDITLRAIKVLNNADGILAEDTRKTGLLLKHLGIQKPIQSYHNFNEHQQLDKIIKRLLEGQQLALVSDAGTPLISDPGYLLTRACLQNGIDLECLPGATALIPALIKSGFPTDRFVFEGFLPHKKGRKTKFESLIGEERSIIFYESPHRLIKTLEQCIEYFGAERKVSVSREISKIFEETITDTADNVLNFFNSHTQKVKGEFVLIISGKYF